MQKNITRFLSFFLTFSISLGVYFVAASHYVQETSPSTMDTFSNSVSRKIENEQNEPSENDFYKISACTDANKFKEYKYPRKSPTITRGVLNGLAICRVSPENIPIAKNENISGIVKVEVLIDEAGEVIKAQAMNGNSLLRQQVEKAVYQIRFCPTLLGGENMKVKGVFVYPFDNKRGFSLQRQFPIRDNFER